MINTNIYRGPRVAPDSTSQYSPRQEAAHNRPEASSLRSRQRTLGGQGIKDIIPPPRRISARSLDRSQGPNQGVYQPNQVEPLAPQTPDSDVFDLEGAKIVAITPKEAAIMKWRDAPSQPNVVKVDKQRLAPYETTSMPLVEGVTSSIYLGGDPTNDATTDNDPRRRILVVDLSDFPRDERGNTLYGGTRLDPEVEVLLRQSHIDWRASKGFKGLRPGETYTLGRDRDNRFNLPHTVSRDHVELGLDPKTGELTMTDHGSTNGTTYEMYAE